MEPQIIKKNRTIEWATAVGVFLASLIVYLKTVAPTASFWDCGEFIACANQLGVMHPPGSPLYMLVGRVMSIFLPFIPDIGLRVNLFSVLISAATVMFTFLVIIQLIKRWRGEPETWENRLILFASGAVGALAFAFSDSQWFNAVEAEVYAFSMFFTALTVWLALKWEEVSEKASGMMLIFMIFYLFSLSAGVHLLNLLVFPFVLMIAYFHHNESMKRLLLIVFLQACVPVGLYILLFQFDPDQMAYQALLDHQAKAVSFLTWFGLIWTAATLVYLWKKDKSAFWAWWALPVLFIVAYSVYLVIYIRAGQNTPINMNDPSTLQGFMDYLTRKQYGQEDMLLTFMHRKTPFWSYQINFMFNRYFAWQFIGKGVQMDALDRIVDVVSFKGLYGLPFLLGLAGAAHHFKKDWKRASSVLALFFLTGYAIIVYLNQPDPQPRERDYSYVGAFFAFALWIGIGLTAILDWIQKIKLPARLMRPALAVVIALVTLAVPVNTLAVNYHSHDRSGNYVAVDYSYNMLQTCEKDAILFTNGDNDTFPLWFLQEVKGIRKDIRIVNLSLLNTPWYILQLRDNEPKVPINLKDDYINSLLPFAWKTQTVEVMVPPAVQAELRAKLPPAEAAKVKDKIEFSLEPTFKAGGGEGLRVQDLMILRILQMNAWKRPVYFGVTVSPENLLGMHQFLRMDGLAFKVMPYASKEIDPDLLKKNIYDVYRYRNLDNPAIFYDTNIVKLLQNYRSAFMRLANEYLQTGRPSDAAAVLDEMKKRVPEEVIPFNDERTALYISDLYSRAGRPGGMEERIKHVIEGRYMSRQDKVWLASYYSRIFKSYDKAEELLQESIRQDPEDAMAYSELIQLYQQSRQYSKGAVLLEDWLLRHPQDSSAIQGLQMMKAMAESDTGRTGP